MYEQLKLDNQLCFRLYAASRLVTQAYTPFLEPLGITYPQYLVLMVLWERDRQVVSEISERLLLESNTLTPLLQRMEKEGLLVRTKGVADGRQTLVSLTKKGKQLEEQAKEVPGCMSRCLTEAPLDETELLTTVKGLDNIIKLYRKQRVNKKEECDA